MKISILTLFPELFPSFLDHSIIKRAIADNHLEVEVIDIRDFAINKHRQVDDYPFGGGAGMLLRIEPVVSAINSVRQNDSLVILTSASGKPYKQEVARELINYSHLVILCGHYEGIDARVENYIDLELSIGDYILTGGEIASMVIVDSVTRLIENVITKESLVYESFDELLLEGPQYTRPETYEGLKVPEVLMSGHHKNIKAWQEEQAVLTTKKKRPDLYKQYIKTKKK